MNRRFTAGLWYALAGMIPGLLFIGGLHPFGIRPPARVAGRCDDVVFVFVFLPACAGFISGALWAEKFHKTAQEPSLSNWIGRGLFVALFAHTTFALLWAEWDGMLWKYGSGSYFFLTMFYGLVWFGWLEAIIGMGAGGALGLFRKKQARLETAKTTRAFSFPLQVFVWVLTVLIITGAWFLEYIQMHGRSVP